MTSKWFSSNDGGGGRKKSQYYVWYLGSKEVDGLRGMACVVPAMRQLLKDSLRKFPNKITVQVSRKGLKLIQTVPTMSKSGKLKTELIKFFIPANALTFACVGPAPFSDIVCCVMIVFNPEARSPVHAHCYRCDSSETAERMHAALASLLDRPDMAQRLVDLERRLIMNGVLTQPQATSSTAAPSSSSGSRANQLQAPVEAAGAKHGHRHNVQHRQQAQHAAALARSSKQLNMQFPHSGRSERVRASSEFDYVGMSSDDEQIQDECDSLIESLSRSRGTPADIRREQQLRRDLFFELRTHLNAGKTAQNAHRYPQSSGNHHTRHTNHYNMPSPVDRRRARSSGHLPYEQHLAQQRQSAYASTASPQGSADNQTTSSTSGFGSDFSGCQSQTLGQARPTTANAAGPMALEHRWMGGKVHLHQQLGAGNHGSAQNQRHRAASEARFDKRRYSSAEVLADSAWDDQNELLDDLIYPIRRPNWNAAQQQHQLPTATRNHIPSGAAASTAGNGAGNNNRRYQKAHEQRMELRMFGDTMFKSDKRSQTGAPTPPAHRSHQTPMYTKQWKSMDNLYDGHHFSARQPPTAHLRLTTAPPPPPPRPIFPSQIGRQQHNRNVGMQPMVNSAAAKRNSSSWYAPDVDARSEGNYQLSVNF